MILPINVYKIIFEYYDLKKIVAYQILVLRMTSQI